MASKADVGFIGLGRMGGPMARNLAQAGHAVHVFDVDPAAIAKAAAVSGITVHVAPGEVAGRVDALLTALPNNEIVTETYLGRHGILAGGRAGLITCDCSTVSPEVSQKIHAEATGRGITHLDTPMLGSSPQAENGEVFFMVGGDPDALRVVQPMLDIIGRLTMHVGASGMGNRIKLLHNALGAVNAVAVAESSRVVLQSDLNGDGFIAGAGETITWRLASGILRRDAGGGAQPIVNGVRVFTLTYLDATGVVTSTSSAVRSVRIELATEPTRTAAPPSADIVSTLATTVRLRNR